MALPISTRIQPSLTRCRTQNITHRTRALKFATAFSKRAFGSYLPTHCILSPHHIARISSVIHHILLLYHYPHPKPPTMSNHQTHSHLKSLLSPTKSGTLFAPFRSRSANPDGFDSKMRAWIDAIEEWMVQHKRLTLSLKDIHQTFISDSGVRPDKECIRLVLSEMKRRSKVALMSNLRTSPVWSSSSKPLFVLDNFIDPKGWISWGVKTLVYSPASWAMSALANTQEQTFSDLTDLSITDTTVFVCQKSLNTLSQNLLTELVRICRAEKQFCFEWQHLLELITPNTNTIIDATDGKELLQILDILIDYLTVNKKLATMIDNDCKLVKIINPEDSKDDEVAITKKDIAEARLLRAKEKLTNDADSYHNMALKAKQQALDSYSRKEISKAKSLLRSQKRYENLREQKESQLTNVEILLDQLENTDSNMMILQAYKDGADALRLANTNLDNNTSVLDDMFDATSEAMHLNEEMNQMMNDISSISTAGRITNAELEAELEAYMNADNDKDTMPTSQTTLQDNSAEKSESVMDAKFVDELDKRLQNLVVCQDDPNETSINASKEEIELAASVVT